jgi:hypothetical protein
MELREYKESSSYKSRSPGLILEVLAVNLQLNSKRERERERERERLVTHKLGEGIQSITF